MDRSPEAVQVHCLAAVLYRAWGDRERADAALARALAAGRGAEPAMLAGAHCTAALLAAREGDRIASEAHHRVARDLAPRLDEELLPLVLHLYLACHALRRDHPAEALTEIEAAVLAGDQGRHPGFEPFALSIRAAAKARLGRLEEALADAAAAQRQRTTLGTTFDVAFQLGVLGQVHLRRREPRQARAALEAALEATDEQPQSSAQTLAALARVRAADDLKLARVLAERAVALGQGAGRVQALLARGWVALIAGENEQASQDAAEARTVACGLPGGTALAEALELLAVATLAPKSAAGLLDDAAGLHRALGDVPGEAQVRLVAAKLRGGGDRHAVEGAEERLRRCGVRLDPGVADALTALASGAPPITVGTLGDFHVCRGGVAVACSEWQSKKARDLFKILIAHRGRPVPRHQLMELLWPDQSPVRTGNRLSVLLTILRRVLDPERRIAYPGPVVADRTAVHLDLRVVDVDVERFLSAASAAQDAHHDGSADAAELLRTAGDLYRGDFLAEDPYEEWAQPLRDETRTAHVGVLRALAAHATNTDDKALCLLRIIHCDPYDEEAHLSLIRAMREAGRHGEAQRRHKAYAERMAELGIEPVPCQGA